MAPTLAESPRDFATAVLTVLEVEGLVLIFSATCSTLTRNLNWRAKRWHVYRMAKRCNSPANARMVLQRGAPAAEYPVRDAEVWPMHELNSSPCP
jgi:hypothetical protein